MAEDDSEREKTSYAKVIALAVIAVLCALLVFTWTPLRTYMQAAAIFFELDSNHMPLVLAPVAHHPAEVTNVMVPGATPLRALLYAPTDVHHAPAIVLIPGVHRLGYDEPRLVAFASALARCGYQVLTPQLPELVDFRITPATVTEIRASILYLSQQTGSPVSVIGLSFAGGLALLAASDPTVQPHVKDILSVGGHASFARVAQYYLTGNSTGADGHAYSEKPNDYGPLILAYEHMGDYVSSQDVTPISEVLRAHLYENGVAENALAARLNPRQQAEWKRIRDSTPEEIAIAKISTAKHQAEMDAVSPEGHVGDLHVPVYLLHGAGDTVIPPTELSWLEQDLPAGDVRSALVSPMISHVSFGNAKPSLGDYWRGLRFLAHFLQAAEA
jgi:pimeloyl-ACP methyl ester carboxylesterase